MPPTSPQQSKNSLAIPIAIVIAGAMIAGAVFFGDANFSFFNSSGSNVVEIEANVPEVSNADRILGSANAEVVVVEYSDLECPFCKVFHATMHRIVEEYQGRVAWVYRHYPIVELHSRAPKEAEASECAAEQGGNAMFWKYIDEVFAVTNANNSLEPAELPRIAERLGLDVNTFNTCLNSGRYTDKIKNAIKEAVAAGARGTPYSVIIKGDEQIPINGAEPYETVRIKIDSVLD